MSVIRQSNLLGQQRLDVPHIKAIESSICGDFDLLAGKIMAGGQPLIVRGFEVLSTGATVTDQLLIKVADSLAIHYFASESGSIFSIPSSTADERLNNTNPRLIGSFAANSVNFVGVDFIRVADDTTSDLVMFLDETTEKEIPKTVPLARTVDYRIVVSTRDFNTLQGVCPIARVVTGAGNQIVSVSDHRNRAFRLGSGGTSANPLSFFTWPGGRKEGASNSTFSGGDKDITSLKGWMDAVMTRLWESAGGENWYSPTSDRNVRVVHTGAPMANGEHFTWSGTHLTWQGLRLTFDNSTASFNDIADQLTNVAGRTDLLSGECLYVDLDRTTDRTSGTALIPQKAPLKTLGVGSPPGSRYVLAWRFGSSIYTRDQAFAVGSSFKIATSASNGTVTLSATPELPSTPKVAADTGSGIMGMAGFSRFATGTTGNLTVGLGVSAGDQNVIIQTTTSPYSVQVKGGQRFSANGKAALEVSQTGPVGDPLDSRIANFKAYQDGVTETNRSFIEADGAIGLAPVSVLPAPPAPSSTDPARLKYFARPSKFWKTACRVATTGALASFTSAGSGSGHVLTAVANGALVVDGVTVSVSDRVLVKNNGNHNGIYTVTAAGSGGSAWVLTRAADNCNTVNVHRDVAVKITAGTTNAGTERLLVTQDQFLVDKVGTFVMEVDVMTWIPTTAATCDQLALMWFDGTSTVISSGPSYFV